MAPPRPFRTLTKLLLLAALLAGRRGIANVGGRWALDHVLIKPKVSLASETLKSLPGNQMERLAAALHLPPGCRIENPPLVSLMAEELAAGADHSAPFLYLHLAPGLTVEECLRQLQGSPLLEYAEPDFIGTGGRIPSDPDFGSQWHHANHAKPSACIHSIQAWNITVGSTNVTVAVLDTGVRASNVEFSGRLVPGHNFAYGTTNTADDYGHGTMVAATLCANAGNSRFGAGVDWKCRLMPIKVLDKDNSGLYSWWAQGITYAAAHGAKVINLSSGGSSASSVLSDAISRAIQKGCIFITITHNDGTNVIRFPGTYSRSITVGATEEQDAKASFSNWGPQISLVAPGNDIYGQGMSGALENWHGTSFSAPLVAGVCSLMAGLRPDLDQTAAFNLLCLGAEDQVGDSNDTPGFDDYYGWGRLNAYNSLLLATTRIDSATVTNDAPVLAWSSPANARTKEPYLVESADSASGPWSDSTSLGAFAYSTNRTTWAGNPGTAGAGQRFYRVRLRSLGTK